MFFSGKNLGDGLHREEYEGCGDCDEKKGKKFKIQIRVSPSNAQVYGKSLNAGAVPYLNI